VLSDIQLYVTMTALGFVVFWILPPDVSGARAWFLTVFSALFVFLISPAGFLAVTFLIVTAWLVQPLLQMRKRWLLFAAIALMLAPLILSRTTGEYGALYTFGLAFATVKILGIVIESYAKSKSYPFRQIALFLYFFPLFTVGPVEQADKFSEEQMPKAPEPVAIPIGLARAIYGLFLAQFVCNQLIAGLLGAPVFSPVDNFANLTFATAWALVILKFLYTYLNFVAFSEIAIGTSRLFGFNVIENFNLPLIASNVQDFWRRYHISMGNWITRYLFFPVVGFLKKSWSNYVATMFAFVIFGLWHAFTPNYLFWGMMHGVALGGFHFYRKHFAKRVAELPDIFKHVQKGVGVVFTIAYVSWLQAFANFNNFGEGITVTKRMLGLE